MNEIKVEWYKGYKIVVCKDYGWIVCRQEHKGEIFPYGKYIPDMKKVIDDSFLKKGEERYWTYHNKKYCENTLKLSEELIHELFDPYPVVEEEEEEEIVGVLYHYHGRCWYKSDKNCFVVPCIKEHKGEYLIFRNKEDMYQAIDYVNEYGEKDRYSYFKEDRL